MFIHDLIKMEYVRQGYLPNYPYHLISDSEMFDAFLNVNDYDWKELGYAPAVGTDSPVHMEYALIPEESNGDDLIDWMLNGKGYIRLYNDNYLAVYWSDRYLQSTLYVNEEKLTPESYGCTAVNDIEAQLMTNLRLKNNTINKLKVVSKDEGKYVTLGIRIGHAEWVKDCYFKDNYRLPDDSLFSEYAKLTSEIYYHIKMYKQAQADYQTYEMPDWVYSYMLGKVISYNSPQADRHDLLVSLGEDNIDDIITTHVNQKCLEISKQYINKYPEQMREHRPPTMFGEPHVLKSIRISNNS